MGQHYASAKPSYDLLAAPQQFAESVKQVIANMDAIVGKMDDPVFMAGVDKMDRDYIAHMAEGTKRCLTDLMLAHAEVLADAVSGRRIVR
jgi:hypothetical protein